MNIKHHLTDPLLMAYSAGQLPEAFNLVVATHVSLCDDCRARLGSFDAIGGAMLATAEPVHLDDDALEVALARIADAPDDRPVPAAPPPASRKDGLPQPLVAYIGGDLSAVKWRPIGMGVRQAVLPTSPEAQVRLLYIPAGVAVPDHGHRGMELTLVLQGAFRDASDRFGPGDIEVADEHMQHKPVAEAGDACICLAATDAPLRFSGLIPKIAQSLFGI